MRLSSATSIFTSLASLSSLLLVAAPFAPGCTSDGVANYNTAPTAAILAPVEGAVLTGTLEFQGRVSDNQQAPEDLNVILSSDADGTLWEGNSDSDGVVSAAMELSFGTHILTLQVVDADAATGSATITLTMVADPPSVEIHDPASGASYIIGEEITFRGTVAAQDGTLSLPIRWSSSLEGTLWDGVSDSSGVTTFTDSILTPGNHTLTLTATYEGDGWSVDGSAQVTIQVEEMPKGDLDQDGDGYTPNEGDCDDFNADVYPGAAEICDGDDNDCNGAADEGFDADGDSYAYCAGDCNDANVDIHPGALEDCDGVDEDCDGTIDDGFDEDGDGYTTCEGDCDDTNSLVKPGALETCDTLDNDCDGLIDEGFDNDSDGFASCGDDCNDSNAAIHPGVPELCDGIDNDCSGVADDGFDVDSDGYSACSGDCDDSQASIHPGAPEVCDNRDNDCDLTVDEGFDSDGDSYTSCEGDCDDGNFAIYPGRTEVCDGVDQDCDGVVDDGFDGDGDGYTTCEGDCDDLDGATHPGAVELCDGEDNDCDATADETFDADHDGWSSCGGDCNDSSASVYPGHAETCDSLDQDCDGLINEGFEGSSEPDNEEDWDTDGLDIGDISGSLSFFLNCGGAADTCVSYAPLFLYYCYETQGFSGRFHSPDDTFDAYYFEYEPVVELFDYGLTPCGVQVSVTNIPTGHDYSVKLYYREDSGDAWSVVDSSDSPGNSSESMSYGSGSWGFDGQYIILVESKGNWSCSGSVDYQISVKAA